MNLKVPIVILDELTETVIRSTGSLDLASGEIFDVCYDVERPGPLGMPASDEAYEYTSGVLTNEGKDVEFRIDVDVMRGQYFVSASELLELKLRAAKLFAGMDGKAMLASADDRAARTGGAGGNGSSSAEAGPRGATASRAADASASDRPASPGTGKPPPLH